MDSTETRGSRWRVAVGTGFILVAASLLPSPLGRHPEFSTFGPDKLLHFLGHAVFSITVGDALAAEGFSRMAQSALAVCTSTALGAAVAFLQQFVPGRVAERADLVAGILGSVCGVAAWALCPGPTVRGARQVLHRLLGSGRHRRAGR